MHMKELPMFTYNLWVDCLHEDKSCQLFCPVINIYCDEQQFQTLSCALYTIFTVIKLDLFIQALLLDYILALEKKYAYALRASCFYIETNIFEHF